METRETRMSEAYWQAQIKSYANQKKGLTIPSSELNEIVRITLGIQPGGIASRALPGGSAEILLSDYFAPAICRATVTRDEEGLHLEVEWIRGAIYQEGQRIRIFPDIAQPSGANRAQIVIFGPNNTIWVSRNAGRDFFPLSPPAKEGERWLLGERISLPDVGPEWCYLHSAILIEDQLYSIESPGSLEGWTFNQYHFADGQFTKQGESSPLPKFIFGPAQRPGDATFWFITDPRADVKHGIYRGDRGDDLVVPNLNGNGLSFLPDGSALVCRSGNSDPPPFGMPGALIYVPARYFN